MSPTVLGEGGPTDNRALPLYTKKRNWIRNVFQKPEIPRQGLKDLERQVHEGCPGVRTRSLSATYNCYGMVFAVRRTYIKDDVDAQMILDDDEFNTVRDMKDVRPGDLIVYRDAPKDKINHIGLVTKIAPRVGADPGWDIEILSQWGETGEYFHRPEQVPAVYGTYQEYVSERKVF